MAQVLRYARVLAASTTSHSHHFCALLGPNAVAALTTLSAIAPVSTALTAPSQLGLPMYSASSFDPLFILACIMHTLSYAPSAARVCLWWWWMCAETSTLPTDFLPAVPLLSSWERIGPVDMFGSILRRVQGPLSASLTCLVSGINKSS